MIEIRKVVFTFIKKKKKESKQEKEEIKVVSFIQEYHEAMILSRLLLKQ